jgi:DNA-directed RNA polymerase subunit RPC12/RpoP
MRHHIHFKDGKVTCTKCGNEVEGLRYGIAWWCKTCRAVIVNVNHVKVVRRFRLIQK